MQLPCRDSAQRTSRKHPFHRVLHFTGSCDVGSKVNVLPLPAAAAPHKRRGSISPAGILCFCSADDDAAHHGGGGEGLAQLAAAVVAMQEALDKRNSTNISTSALAS